MELKDKNVLVVDNHEQMPEFISKMLHRLFGCVADCAGSLEEALSAVVEKEYALVIVNNRLLGDSGGEVIIKTVKLFHGSTKTIMTSSFEWDSEVAEKSGADVFLQKPFGLEQLNMSVLAALRREEG
jgi:DNA-binding response OmpR family regulator